MRIIALAATFVIAFFLMHDDGFSPKGRTGFLSEVKDVISESVEFGFKNRAVRWMMLSAIFTGGIGIFGFYAMQPYLLELYGNSGTYAIAGISAAIVAGAQILGGVLVRYVGPAFKSRTSILLAGLLLSTASLVLIGLAGNFWIVLGLLAVWAIVFSSLTPVRQAYMNGIIPSKQRATVLSLDNMLTSVGGVISQPTLGRVAEVWGYPMSYLGSAAFQILALPLLMLARREKAESDPIK
jgi:MFS family permease